MDLESVGCRRTGSRPAETVACQRHTASGEGAAFARLEPRHLTIQLPSARHHRRIVRWLKDRPAVEPFIVEVVKHPDGTGEEPIIGPGML